MTWGVTTCKLPIFLQERQALVLVLSQLSGKAARLGTLTTHRSFSRRVLSYSIRKRRYVLGTPSQSLSCCPVLHICPSSFISLQFHSNISSPCPFIPLYIPITTTLQHFLFYSRILSAVGRRWVEVLFCGILSAVCMPLGSGLGFFYNPVGEWECGQVKTLFILKVNVDRITNSSFPYFKPSSSSQAV